MQDLEIPAISFAVDIIGNRRTLVRDRQRQDFANILMQSRRASLAESRRDRQRMNPRQKQRLVDINVAHARQELLIEQQRLDLGLSRTQSCYEIVERNFQRLGPQRARSCISIDTEFDASELARIVVYQHAIV